MQMFPITVFISKGSPQILEDQSVKFRADFTGDVDLIIWFVDGSVVSMSNGSSMEFRHRFSAGSHEVKCKINSKYYSEKIIRVYSASVSEDTDADDPNLVNLRFINRSNTVGGTDIIVFQKNLEGVMDENIVAWQICTLAQDEADDIVYDKRLQLGYNVIGVGRVTTVNASVGNIYGLNNGVYYSGEWMSPSELATFNTNPYAIVVEVYRSGNVLSALPAGSDDTSLFRFNPTIWVGVVSSIEEGDVLDSGTVASINTEISLLGIKSADVVMVGGGVGPSAVPYSFMLENIEF